MIDCLPQTFLPLIGYFDMNQKVPRQHLTDLAHRFPILSAATEEVGHPIPEGIKAIGKQEREEYEELVASVSVMLGIGFPPISPSVWTAL